MISILQKIQLRKQFQTETADVMQGLQQGGNLHGWKKMKNMILLY